MFSLTRGVAIKVEPCYNHCVVINSIQASLDIVSFLYEISQVHSRNGWRRTWKYISGEGHMTQSHLECCKVNIRRSHTNRQTILIRTYIAAPAPQSQVSNLYSRPVNLLRKSHNNILVWNSWQRCLTVEDLRKKYKSQNMTKTTASHIYITAVSWATSIILYQN